MDFTSFDYVVILLIAIFGIFGFFKGFINSILSLARWIISFYIAANFAYLTLPIVHQLTQSKILANLISFIILFVILYIVISVINYGIKNLLSGVNGGIVDRFFGGCFGAFKILFIMTIVFLYYTTMVGIMNIHYNKDTNKFSLQVHDKPHIPFIPSNFIKTSKTVPVLMVSTKLLIKSLPRDIAKQFDTSSHSQDDNTQNDNSDTSEVHDTQSSNNTQQDSTSEGVSNILLQKTQNFVIEKIKSDPEFASKIIKIYNDKK